jgi:toxin ParE1/3/4
MRVRWTTDAANDLAKIVDRIRAENPGAALHVARTIYNAVSDLRKFPASGRAGLVQNTKELIFPPWPYIVVYEVHDDQVIVLRVRHASRNWP